MPNLLVTLCNLAQPRETALLHIQSDTGAIKAVPVGATVPVKSCTGLIADDKRVYVLCADSEVRTYLAVLDKVSFKPLNFQFLPEIIDGHSMLLEQGRLLIVSTGNDAVFAYDVRNDRAENPTLAWNIPDQSGTHHDTHHLNSIARFEGDIVFSAFGAKTGQTWSTAVNGYVGSLSGNSTLASAIYQPHSLKEWGGRLYYCESARGRIASLDGSYWDLGDYTRGLDFLGDDIAAVGSSVGRKISKSTGLINNPGDPGAKSGSCEINVVRLSSGSTPARVARISLTEHGSEIYDLLCLDKIEAGTETPWHVAGALPAQAAVDPAMLLEQHQILSELSRAQEIQLRELLGLKQDLKSVQETNRMADASIEQHAARVAALDRELANLKSELQTTKSEFARFHDAVRNLEEAQPSWLRRLFGKQR